MKKYNIFRNIALGALVVSSLSSCEDYLSLSNPNKTTVETFWTDLKDTKSGLYATYAALRNDYVLNIREEAWRSDLCWPGYGRPQPQNNAEGWNWYCQNYTNSTVAISSKWDALYISIWRANQVIEALERIKDTVSGDEIETWNIQMGHARFIRGLMYFYLHSSFNNGSVVLRTSTAQSFNLPLSPAEDVLKFFREDLEVAYDLLPVPQDVTSDYEGLATKGTAATIQGISYLYEKEYSEAEMKFKDVIDNYGYELEQDWTKMFTNAGEFNSESILEISYSLDYRQDITTWDMNCMYNRLATLSTSLGGFLPAAWLVNEFLNDKPDNMDSRNTGRQVSLRASAMVALVQDEVTPYYINGNASEKCPMGGPLADWGFGKFKKYTNHDIVTKEKPSMSGKNVVVNRLSDVYLMYAECLLQRETPDIAGALLYINKVRARWGVELLGIEAEFAGIRTYDGESYTKDELMEHLMFVERPLELATEGHQIRWQDLRRWGLLEDDGKNIFKLHHDNDDFWSVEYTAKKLNSNQTQTKNNSTVQEGSGNLSLNYEFEIAAQNYSKERNLYFPIPQKELMNNSAIKNNN